MSILLLEIFKYILPSIIVFLTTWYLVRSFIRNEEIRRKDEILMASHKTLFPVKLQAYERATVFLERINPDSLLKRIHKNEMTVGELQARLLSTIRSEFEHNFAQQIYMSNYAWQQVVKAKENIVKLVNINALKFKPEAPAINLSKAILEEIFEIEKSPSLTAIEIIKQEIQSML